MIRISVGGTVSDFSGRQKYFGNVKITQPRFLRLAKEFLSKSRNLDYFSFCKWNFFQLNLQILQRVVTWASNAYRPRESQRRPVDQLILFKISFGCSYDPDHDFMDDRIYFLLNYLLVTTSKGIGQTRFQWFT
jgi:hypothetical protein